MSAFPKVKHKWTVEEYLAMEAASDEKHEFIDGVVYTMERGSIKHIQLVGTTSAHLYLQLRDHPCEVLFTNMRLKISKTGNYTYPDIVVVCGKPEIERLYGESLLKPTVIIEVLSPSTENYDRNQKFQSYRTLESLQEYVLISQDSIRVEHFVRHSDHWRVFDLTQSEENLTLASIGCTLSVREIYEKVTFDHNV